MLCFYYIFWSCLMCFLLIFNVLISIFNIHAIFCHSIYYYYYYLFTYVNILYLFI